MRRLHVVPARREDDGMWIVASRLAMRDGDEVRTTREPLPDLADCDEVWVHGLWLPRTWWVCQRVLWERRRQSTGKPRLVRMLHGALSPVYLTRQSPIRKRLVSPIERHLFRCSDRVIVTGEHERRWAERWAMPCRIEVLNLKELFGVPCSAPSFHAPHDPLRVLYLGRRHPLKGVAELEMAVAKLNAAAGRTAFGLRIVTEAFGTEKTRVLEWCDVLVLPTLSENFGLVVAEALIHGRPAIVTDGAPVWENHPGVTYLSGYVKADDEVRVSLLMSALERIP